MINLQAIVSLDTGDRTEHIYIYEGDDIELLAEYFCERHNIMPQGKTYIIQEIVATLNSQDNQTSKTKNIHQANPSMTSLNSQAMIPKLIRNKTENDVFEYLYKEAWNKEQRKQQAQEDHFKEQNKNIQKKPEINEQSNFIALQRSKSSNNVFDKLYGEHQILNFNKQKKSNQIFNKLHPFKPQLNRKQWEIRQTRKDQVEHANRLISEKSISAKRLEVKRNQANSLIDQKNGQEFFKPKINKNHVFNKVSKKVDIEDQQIAQQIQNRKLTLNSNNHHNRKQIFQSSNKKQIGLLFAQLDSDRDGQISTQFINLNINHQILEKIIPVLCHMEEQHLILDIDSFIVLLNSFQISIN